MSVFNVFIEKQILEKQTFNFLSFTAKQNKILQQTKISITIPY